MWQIWQWKQVWADARSGLAASHSSLALNTDLALNSSSNIFKTFCIYLSCSLPSHCAGRPFSTWSSMFTLVFSCQCLFSWWEIHLEDVSRSFHRLLLNQVSTIFYFIPLLACFLEFITVFCGFTIIGLVLSWLHFPWLMIPVTSILHRLGMYRSIILAEVIAHTTAVDVAVKLELQAS